MFLILNKLFIKLLFRYFYEFFNLQLRLPSLAELIHFTIFFSDAEADKSTTVVYFTSLGMSMKAAVTFITVGGSTRNGSELSF